ncbi:MAG: DUF1080 domain-containing protein [Vicinamibacteria bacterium]
MSLGRTALLALALGGASSPVVPDRPIDLFPKGSLADWEYVAGLPTDIAQVAAVSDGVVTVAGKPSGYLATRTAYTAYVLHAEWRWADLTQTSKNGGVLVHITSGPVQQGLWPTSLQVQLKTEHEGDILSMGDAHFMEAPSARGTATSPSDTLARHENTPGKPLGDWNSADVTVRGDVVEVTVNGVLQNRVSGCTPSSGRIGFQLEGQPFQLRNVAVSRLPKNGL